MRRRNEALHAEITRLLDLEAQWPDCKTIAKLHKTSAATVRTLLSRARKLRKLTSVNSQSDP